MDTLYEIPSVFENNRFFEDHRAQSLHPSSPLREQPDIHHHTDEYKPQTSHSEGNARTPIAINQPTALPLPALSKLNNSESLTHDKQHGYIDTIASTVQVDDETIACATLTHCIQSANAIMFALVQGVGNAQETLRLILDSHPKTSQQLRTATVHECERLFTLGIQRWGRSIQTGDYAVLHKALTQWHQRIDLLRTTCFDDLSDQFTQHGTQWILAAHSPYWPKQLNDLALRAHWAPPLCIWGQGDMNALTSCDQPIAIVGSRSADEYGKYVAKTIAQEAGSLGHLIISGGALGADAAAHWGTLANIDNEHSMYGRTIAVFAGGLNHIGPERNRNLFHHIVESRGALISELCPSTIPEPHRFLLRNRIIAALSSSIVVVQARFRSGALNTANWGSDLHRNVYAIPGAVTAPHNAGCNKLIHDNRAILLCTEHCCNEICHTAHSSPPSDTTELTEPTDEQNIEPKTEEEVLQALRMPEKTTPPSTEHTSTEKHTESQHKRNITQQQLICRAIRSCKRQHIPASIEEVFNRVKAYQTEAAQTQPTDRLELNIQEFTAILGEMELLGSISYHAGTIDTRSHW